MNLDLPPCHELLAAPTAATATVDALLAVPRAARCVEEGAPSAGGAPPAAGGPPPPRAPPRRRCGRYGR